MFAVKFDHVAVTVSNMDRSLEFYCDLLGLIREGEHDLEGETISKMAGKDRVRMKVVRLVCPETPGIQIDLQEYIEPRGKMSDSKLGDAANSHFCIEVDDIQRAYEEMQAKGVEFVSEPVQFDLEDAGKIGCVFFYDPDGYVLELMEMSK
jgi:catechol 2,3-dioxygenase-like lactoylglutathione lyase family enzyme